MRVERAAEYWARCQEPPMAAVGEAVAGILATVKREGDAALRRFTAQWDGAEVDELRVPRAALEAAWHALPEALQCSLSAAAERIEAFHRPQLPSGYTRIDEAGNRLEEAFVPLARVGLYIPGGRAAYPSSVLMAAIPARLAGVGEIVLCTPPRPDGSVAPIVLAAAWLAGVGTVVRVGGAQAVAAMAYGTASVPRVDKIVGPGNAYVTEAKRQLAGVVGIDGLNGPSEVVVLADATAPPAWVAAELLAQAEHDPEALAVAVCLDEAVAEAVVLELEASLKRPPAGAEGRAAIAAEALAKRGGVILAQSPDEAADIVNRLAPEHLAIYAQEAEGWLAKLPNGSSVFLGAATPVAAGDYGAGPNHVLPTGGSARFASPLGVLDFLRRRQVLAAGPAGAADWLTDGARLAEAEGLPWHAQALRLRAEALAGADGAASQLSANAVVKLDQNESPYPWPGELLDEVAAAMRRQGPMRYPTEATSVRAAVAAYAGVAPDQVALGLGSDENLEGLLLALTSHGGLVAAPSPTFTMYERFARRLGRRYQAVAMPDLRFDAARFLAALEERPELIFLCRPNNPTGELMPETAVAQVLATGTWVVVDEAYMEFAGETLLPWLGRHRNLIVLRTLSKAAGLAGQRLGYALAQAEVAERLRQAAMPHNITRYTALAAQAILKRPALMRSWVAATVREREALERALAAWPGLTPWPSRSNFILVAVDQALTGMSARQLVERLRQGGVAVRYFQELPELADHFRVSVGRPEENARFLAVLKACLDARPLPRAAGGDGGGA